MAHKFRTLLKDIYGKFACDYCKKPISDRQRFVRLDTYDLIHKETKLSEYVEQIFYHYDCWKNLMNDMIQSKFKEASIKMAGVLKSIIPMALGRVMIQQKEDGR
jgi:hypothetical protein